jgi:hypothetical protein
VHFERQHLNFSLKQFVLYPADCTDEATKEEKSHYIYVCRKLPGAEQICKDNWEKVIAQLKREQDEEAKMLIEQVGDDDDSD